jgi:REP element-mobilizing transposase RayT
MPNSYTNLLFHIVSSTKNRRGMISDQWRGEFDKYVGGLVSEKGGELLDIGVPDHVHLSIRTRPDISVSDLMCFIKANSSGWIHKKGFCPEFDWQDGYGAFTVSKSQAPALSNYIRTQPQHHSRRSFEEEFAELLERHGIEYDPRYLWK